jgi:hypothetical protein
MSRISNLLSWAAALYIAGVLLWYEQYKLPGADGSVWLFTVLSDWLGIPGHEKAFRLSVAVAEIIASVLVLVPATRIVGAVLSLGIISGAIFFHLVSPLGVDPYGDGGHLFKEACAVWLSSAFILVVQRREALAVLRRMVRFGGWPTQPASARGG